MSGSRAIPSTPPLEPPHVAGPMVHCQRDSQLMSLSSWLEMGSRYYSKITNRMSRL